MGVLDRGMVSIFENLIMCACIVRCNRGSVQTNGIAMLSCTRSESRDGKSI